METIDLIFLVLTIIIAYRLYSVFGQRNETEVPKDIMDGLQKRFKGAPTGKESPVLTAEKQIRHADPKFTPTKFLDGAQKAYEMIIHAYAKGDKDTLKDLLSADLYKSYAEIIDARHKKKQTLSLDFFRLIRADIDRMEVLKSTAKIHVKFKSEQTQILKDAKGKVLEGDPDHLEPIEEIWVFERPLKATNPNWTLVNVTSLDDD